MSKSLIEVLEENDVKLEASGERFKASCPFHTGDQTPSFTVYPTGTYFCFGCEVWGDAVKFLIEYKHLSMTEALEYVGIDYKTAAKRARTVIKVRNTGRTYPFLGEVVAKYHAFLLQQTGAISYLLRRGLTYDTINKFKLGYTDGRVLNLQFAEEMSMAREAGLINENGYELLSHRIVIPNMIGNDCDFMIGRTVTNDSVKYLGIRTPKPIFGLTTIHKSPIVFLAEGQFDYLILRQWGYPAVVIGGTHLTKANLGLLKGKKVIVVPDCDAPGMVAADKIAKSLPDVTILDYSAMGVKDVAEAAERPDGEGVFKDIVRSQVWVTTMSQTTLARWFPRLSETQSLHST